jgi:protein-S-isoprenylcysteine O-methyltransferase Ste14
MPSPDEAPSEQDKDLIRQGERTVDNLKRLFAVVFALSFAALAGAAIDKLRPLMTEKVLPPPALLSWMLNIEMLVVFVVTAGVFYHQSTKFLDIRYAKHPWAEAHPLGFALDYLTLVLTAAPFFLMAHGFSTQVTHRVGYLWFFGAYVLLLGFGLTLLMVSEFRHSRFVRVRILKETISDQEIQRESTLRTYWFVMNSFVLLVLIAVLKAATYYSPCPLSHVNGKFPVFLFFFGAVALARDYFDFRYAWRFLYPMRPESAPLLDKWPLTAINDPGRRAPWMIAGYAFLSVSIVILLCMRFWDLPHWVAACSPT